MKTSKLNKSNTSLHDEKRHMMKTIKLSKSTTNNENREISKTITYNLNMENQEEYYSKIKTFTLKIIDESKIDINDIISDFQQFLIKNPVQNIYINSDFSKNYNFEEHVFETLFLGVMWKNYMKIAIDLDPFYQNIMAKLSNLRDKKEISNLDSKAEIDEIRGLLASKYLYKKKNEKFEDNKNFNDPNLKNSNNDEKFEDNKNFNDPNLKNLNKNENSDNLNLKNLNKLLDYLEASGDYKESLKHLNIWKSYFSSQKSGKVEKYLNRILSFTNWFEKIANEELHQYTFNVDNFRKNKINYHLNNEDILFCNRNESEYHLNIFGAEVMNRTFQKEFKKRDRTVIFIPGCMRIYPAPQNKKKNQDCKAIEEDLGLKCVKCRKECNISQLVSDNYFKSFEIYINDHNSAILSNITAKDKKDLAIVGIACINNLIEGGWKISSWGIPAQCVILDYVGCKKHWDEVGFPTQFNLKELKKIID